MESILNLVQEYITKKDSEKKWVAGEDLVQYAGPYFDGQEAQAVVKTMLEGWLVLGKAIFPPKVIWRFESLVSVTI